MRLEEQGARPRPQLDRRRGEPTDLEELAEEEAPTGMNAKTALLAGIVVGVTIMVGVVGFLAWREKKMHDEEQRTPVVEPAPAPSK